LIGIITLNLSITEIELIEGGRFHFDTGHTVCFTDLGMLNLLMLTPIEALANFCHCPSSPKKQCLLKEWSKLTDLNQCNRLYMLCKQFETHIQIVRASLFTFFYIFVMALNLIDVQPLASNGFEKTFY
jgi:hypothetical protein